MARTIRDVMNETIVALDAGRSVTDAARMMRERDIGDVLVTKDGGLCGIVTDRDIVVRCLADGKDPDETELGNFCSTELVTLGGDSAIDDAVQLMREKAIRRIPIEEDGKPIGIVSLGDLAQERDPESALGQISSAPASH